MSTATQTYPTQHEQLLRDIGLIKDEQWIVVPVQHKLNLKRSKDGQTWEDMDVEVGGSVANALPTYASPTRAENGLIAGYWANGLTEEQKRIVHNECGVPKFNVNEMHQNGTWIPDTAFTLFTGKVYNLQNPSETAEFRCLWYSYNNVVGRDESDALQNQVPFYFQNVAYQHDKRKKDLNDAKAAAMLMHLKSEEKLLYLRLSMYESGAIGELASGTSEEDYCLTWDEMCMASPKQCLSVSKLPLAKERLMVYTLLHYGELTQTNSVIYGKDMSGRDVCVGETLELAASAIRETQTYAHYHRTYATITKNGLESGAYTPNVAKAPVVEVPQASTTHHEWELLMEKSHRATKDTMMKWNEQYSFGLTFPHEVDIATVRSMIQDMLRTRLEI